MTTTSQVRVGVRLRPITPKETSSGGSSIIETDSYSSTVSLSKRKFTYDSVYSSKVSQSDLYLDVSPPLLEAFLNGYNATVLAYGQTGSGKTYTMGSESHDALESNGGELRESDGLIPRFMADIFGCLEKRRGERRKQQGEPFEALIDYSLEASFLEVYGEDIHDLLDEDRKSLPIREDSNGEVIVVGLTSNAVKSDAEAMHVLNTGTMNRTTAATLMNVTSSRSHAVFTINLKQIARGSDGVDVVTSSRFTFVDLAGSERMKKTGAEGERMKEGIRINEGLLALGNVINALADEERLSKREKVHVPYRQSKLTRLLQDALGGNSQTLFLACVSPSDTNASETLSTLQYANRARNIKNAPTRNVDASVLELQNLRVLTNVLKCELIKQRFGSPNESESQKELGIGELNNDLLQLPDVLSYMTAIDEKVADITGCAGAVSSYPISVSALPKRAPSTSSVSSGHASRMSTQHDATVVKRQFDSNVDSNAKAEEDDALIFDVNPDEDMKILDELLELQHREQQFHREQQDGQEQLDSMEGEIEAQEGRLNKLKESLIMYHNIKVKYEKLMTEVHGLEAEKQALADALEKATVDPTKGCSKAIKRKLQDVEDSLARARSETRKHQQLYRQAEQEAQKCKVLERKIWDLKHAKVNLMKKQKEEATKHKEFTNQKAREIHALKRKEKTTEKKISKIEAENQKFRHNLERSRAQNDKLSEKLKQTETHLMRLLTKRRNDLTRNTSRSQSKVHGVDIDFEGSEQFAPSNEEIKSLKFILEKTVNDRVKLSQQLEAYEAKVVEHGKVMQSMAKEVKVMNKRKREIRMVDSETGGKLLSEVKEHEENVQEYQLKLEIIENDLEQLRAKCPRIEEYYFDDDPKQKLMREKLPALKMISKIDAPVLRTLLREFLESHIISEHQRRSLKETLTLKESSLHSFEKEVELQNSKIEALSKSLGRHRRMSSCIGPDHADATNDLEMAIKTANAKLEACMAEKAEVSTELAQAQQDLTLCQIEHAKAEERLALALAHQKLSQSTDETTRMLTELQDIWAEVGVAMNDRQAVRQRLLSCVEDACSQILVEASELRDARRREVNGLRSTLQEMHRLLGSDQAVSTSSDETKSRESIDGQLESLNVQLHQVRAEYEGALERCQMLIQDAEALACELHASENEFGEHLTLLIKSGKPLLHKPPGNNKSLSSPRSHHSVPLLSASFLDACEKDIKRLRLVKSGKLLSSVEICNTIRSIANDMHANLTEVASMVLYKLKRRSHGVPSWWNDSVSDQVYDAVFKQGSLHVDTAFTKHLSLVLETLHGITHGRKLLSDVLRQVVEDSHTALLETAEGSEMDFKDLYQSVHNALFQLPPLSKQYVKGCIDEMKMIVAAAESITQSEIETLTVLWEGLNLSSSERGLFWSKLEESASKVQMQPSGPFDQVLNQCRSDIEDWVLTSLKEATKVQTVLGVRVFKLRSVHAEVERLKKKQDAKNGIMSLNGELKLLSAKLTDFEEQAGNRDKLTKRVNSSTLLEEERFRKQMQGKFASKLEELKLMLNDWEAMEGAIDDSNMLSEVVKSMLENSHRIDAWMNERTRFMHLRTTQTKSKARETEYGTSNGQLASRRGPTSTPRTGALSQPSSVAQSVAKVSLKHKLSSTERCRKTPLSGTSHNAQQQITTVAKPAKKSKSPTIEVPEVLLPFGNLLADTPTTKENMSQF